MSPVFLQRLVDAQANKITQLQAALQFCKALALYRQQTTRLVRFVDQSAAND